MFYVTYYIAKYFVLFIIDGSSVFFGLTTINSLPLWQVVDVVLFNVDVWNQNLLLQELHCTFS